MIRLRIVGCLFRLGWLSRERAQKRDSIERVLQARADALKIAVAQNDIVTKAASRAIDRRMAESDRLRHTVKTALQLMRKEH